MITVWLMGGPLDGESVEVNCNDEDFVSFTVGYTQDATAKSADYKRYSPLGQIVTIAIYAGRGECPVETDEPYDKVVVSKAVDTILAHKPPAMDFDELADRGEEIRGKTYGLIELMEIFKAEEDE